MADIGRQLGVQAVLIGAINEAFERTERRAAAYAYVTQPQPECCRHHPPCPSRLVYDALVQGYVDSCGTTHRRITLAPGSTNRYVGFAARVQLIDVDTKSILWESRQDDQPFNDTLYQAADRVVGILSDRLLEDAMKRSL